MLLNVPSGLDEGGPRWAAAAGPPHKYGTFHHDLDYNPATRTFLGLYKYLHHNASGIDDKAVYGPNSPPQGKSGMSCDTTHSQALLF